jgi:hypothetical protein
LGIVLNERIDGGVVDTANNPRQYTAIINILVRRLLSLAIMMLTASGWAQTPIAASTQFDITGFIQQATLDSACPTSPHCGGIIKVNGHIITVPRETIVILPANALTWQEIFTQAPAPYGLSTTPPSSGLALADVPAPLTTYEAHVVGNRVIGTTDQYIAGLISIWQQSVNTGAGFINYINYSTGELRVGGTPGSSTSGTRVQLNDPVGRYGRVVTPDRRFTVDTDNPTVRSTTGFPMCIPRVDPGSSTPDALCPQSNRPAAVAPATGFAATIQMNDPGALPGVPPDATKQAPFEVGDYIFFAGTLVHDGSNPTAGPWPTNGTAATYISAHTITNNVAIYTAAGTNPSYVAIDVSLIGTGGVDTGAVEATVRTRFEGFTTDPSRIIHLYGIDLDPSNGTTTDRDWGEIGVEPGPPGRGIKGRWRYNPPCTATTTPTDQACTPPPAGTLLPPTREVRAVIEGEWVPGQTTSFANGIIAGQYHAPIATYIFPENVPGNPIVANNFNSINFLAFGGYTSSAGTLVGVLNPWPNDTAPSQTCYPAVASAGGPYTVASGGTVTLLASATGTSPFTFSWTPPSQGTISPTNVPNPVYTAPFVSSNTNVSVLVTVTNCGGPSVASGTVTVTPAGAPTVNPVPPISVASGASASFSVSGSDPNGLALTFTAVQSGSPALQNLTVTSTGPTSANVSFTAPTLPLGQVTSTVINLSITATNSVGVHSAPASTTVTVKPLPDTITVTSTTYRTGKQNLIINATSSVVSPNVILTLQPYVTTSGNTYNPDPAAGGIGNTFTNNGAGSYTISLVGVPEPAVPPATPLDVKSNLNGDSGFVALTNIRQ